MTKGQFALLTAVLGLVTMGGAGYFAYASTSPHGTSASGASADGQPSANSGGVVTVPSDGSSPTGTDGAGSGSTGGDQGGGRACQNGEIQVTDKQGQGAAGTISLVLVFQNVSGHACTLHGYPGASLVDQTGADLLDATRQLPDGLAKAPVVLLAPGAQADALLLWSDVAGGSGCAGQNAASLLVTPPNTTQSSKLSLGGAQICSSFRVRPVLSGVTSG